jgi:predicted AlkP superfamily phosphohydrolase/phosphomutase
LFYNKLSSLPLKAKFITMCTKGVYYAFLGIFSSIVLLSTCGQKKDRIEIDLTSSFSQLPVLIEKQNIDFSDSASKLHYIDGFFSVKPSGKSQFARTVESRASLRFFFHNKKNLSLLCRLRANQFIQIESHWNGIPLPAHQVAQGRTEVKWKLFSEWVEEGINTLEFSFNSVNPDPNRQTRIDIFDVSFSPLALHSKPELTVSKSSQTVKIQGPIKSSFFLRTYLSSKLKFAHRSQKTEESTGFLKISIIPPNGDRKDKNIRLESGGSSEWQKESIDLSSYNNQFVKIEFLHLTGCSTITEIRNPVLTGRIASTSNQKVLLIGVDGAAWEVIDPLIAQGKLPHFKQLLDSGSHGRLRSVRPMYSPLIWTSMVTGKTKDKHGITGFLKQKKQRAEGKIPNTRLNRKCLALWNILSDEGKVVGIVGPWVTWPAERVNGFLLTDRIYFDRMPRTAYPEELVYLWYELKESLKEKLDDPYYRNLVKLLEPDSFKLRSPVHENLVQEKNYLTQDVLKSQAGQILYSFLNPDFYFLYLRAPDVTSHFFWKYFQPDDTVSPLEIDAFSDVIPSAYMYVDALIGKHLNMTPRDSTIFIVSDHGMGPKSYRADYSFDNMERLWRQIGIQENIRTTRIKESRIFLSFHSPVERSGAQAVLKDVMSGHKKRPLFQSKISKDLKALILEMNNIFYPDGDTEVFFRSKKVGKLEDYVSIVETSGNHTLYGILIMKGPHIRGGYRLKDYSVLDVAPTILYLLGLPVPKDIDGNIIGEAFLPEFRENNPLRLIDTYEGRRSQFQTDDTQQKADRESEKRILERLKTLGYIN